MRIRVKICGVTLPEWACVAADAGADAVGLIFADSPRRVTTEQAVEIARALPPWVAPVGVFVDASARAIRETAGEVGLAAVQLHGDEPPEILAELGWMKVIKAFGIGSEDDLAAARAWRKAAEHLGRTPDAYLVDARVAAGPKGGTGEQADWDAAASMIGDGFTPLILAGGLGPVNVADAVRAVGPWGVDSSSGTETEPGRKSPEKIRAFVEAVRAAQA